MGIAAIFAILYALIGLGLGAFWPSLLGSDDGNPTESRRRELRRAELMSAFSNSPVPHKAKFAVYEGITWVGAALWPIFVSSNLWQRHRHAKMRQSPGDRSEEMEFVCHYADAGDHTSIAWHSVGDAQDSLRRFWDADWEKDVFYELGDDVRWRIGLSTDFMKSIAKIDKKLQGRFLALASAPMEPHGDTIKPLEGNLKGLWRYRIADYRLVYAPDQSQKTIVMLKFTSRGEASEP